MQRASDAYDAAWDEDMSPAALAGFSAAWAFFTDVLPAAASLAPGDVAAAARAIDLPPGSLPNGSGLRFGAPGHAGRRRQPRGRQRHLGMGGARRGRRDLAACVRDPAHGSERVGRVVSRRTTIVVGVLCVTAYAGLAALSGHLSPLARGPLLDGIGPPQDYRWVNPPPDLAANNQPPSSGVFPIALDPNGSRPATPVTSDNQVTVIVPRARSRRRPDRSRSR